MVTQGSTPPGMAVLQVYVGKWRETQVAVKMLRGGAASTSDANAAGLQLLAPPNSVVENLQKVCALIALVAPGHWVLIWWQQCPQRHPYKAG